MDNSQVYKDCQCTLCFELLFYPVTLPCKHHFCKLCFEKHIECNGFTCPLCRARISNWLRKVNLNDDNIVDTKLWKFIEQNFPVEVANRRNGDVNFHFLPGATNNVPHEKTDTPRRNLAEPGEIRQEYECFMQKQQEEKRRLTEKNFRLSEDLIRMIEEDERQEEEARKKELEAQLRADEELARSLVELESKQSKEAISVDESKDDSDVSNSSPFKNSDEFNRDFMTDNPVFLGPCMAKPVAVVNLSSSSSEGSAKYSTPKRQVSPTLHCVNLSPIPIDAPSTSTAHHAALNPVPSTSRHLSHFATVTPGPSTSTAGPSEVQMPKSRCSSGADSIGQELNHFKPICTSPTTPAKGEGSRGCLPQVVVPQRGVRDPISSQELDVFDCDYRARDLMSLERTSGSSPQVVVSQSGVIPQEVEVVLSSCDISKQDLEESISYEYQLEADMKLAMEISEQWNAEEDKKVKKRAIVRTDYNLRKRRKGNLRKKVLLDRAQATLDSMLIK